MLESLVIDKIIEIFKKNIPIDEVMGMDIVDNSKIGKQDSIVVIERRLKNQINELVLYYGIVDALKKLMSFQHELKNAEQNNNTIILSIGTKVLYDRILGFYSPIIYTRLIKWFPRLSNGTITSKEILEDIKKIPFTEEFLLGINEYEGEQISLFGENLEKTNDLVVSLNNKNKVKNNAIKVIRKIFSKSEINEMLLRLSEILNDGGNLESIIFLRSLLKEIPDINKDISRKKKSDLRQLRIRQF